MRLGLLLLRVYRGILHEGLVGVGAPDVAPPTIKSLVYSRGSPVGTVPPRSSTVPARLVSDLLLSWPTELDGS
ncbi:hypothetical protein BHE74_00003963 [Ensete ventricosum]|nr:hypothetical protein GW17_00016893 [Ensete ventricosum]RWW87226.1 hypothetical protein BHE74_00003963 [Ensete ventricosum]